MNLAKYSTNSILLVFLLFTLCCTAQKRSNSKVKEIEKITFQNEPIFKFDKVQFQEWYAGIKVGGTGFTIFFPNLTNDETIVFEKIYFRNLIGSLVKGKGMYISTLKNNSPFYTWEYPKKPSDYPFDLLPDECIISYKENGQLKYTKITSLDEKAGTYYENGPPSVYDSSPHTIIATVEDDN